VILDMVGGDYVARNLKALAMEGRLVQIAWLGGSRVEGNFASLMLKRLTWTGSTLRPRSIEEKGRIARSLEAKVWPLLAKRAVQPIIHVVLPLDQAEEAHRLMESSRHIGKIILETGRG
jgi:NADPH:quinone reductase